MMRSKLIPLIVIVILLSLSLASTPSHASTGYVPKAGDYFNYHETIDVNNCQGNYCPYSDHTVTDGGETMNTAYPNGTVAAHYGYSWSFSNSSGYHSTGSSKGNFTYSSSTFYYVKGTDNQTGYVNPTVWFYMDNTVLGNARFELLNTQMTVLDTNASYQLASQNRYVQSIHGQGSGSYHRNDIYGNFNAAYTWDTYSDPSTGYIIGYNYLEHDTDNSGNGFTYTDNLYVTTTSYQLATGTAPPGPGLSSLLYPIIAFVVILFIIIIIVVVAVIARRRRGLPQHAYDYSRQPTPYAPPAPQTINLEPKQPPAQQIVIKEVAKVKCKYCGALVDTTALVCPICGGATT